MATTAPYPSCAVSCISNAAYQSNCLGFSSEVCLCTNQEYIAAFHACIESLCSSADQQSWIQYGEAGCSAVGVTFSTTTGGRAAVSTAVGVVASSTAVRGAFTSTFDSNIPTTIPSSLSSPTIPITSSYSSPASSSQSSSGDLSSGAKVGIAMGAVGIVLIGILIALLLWRRYRQRSKTKTNSDRGGVYENPYGEKEVGAPMSAATLPYKGPLSASAGALPFKEPVSSANAVTELSDDNARFTGMNAQPVKVPELPHDPAGVTSPWTPSDANYLHELSPSAGQAMPTAIPRSEIGDSNSPFSSYVPSYQHRPAEADSRSINHNTFPYTHELDNRSLPPELSPSTIAMPAIPYNPSPPAYSGSPAGVMRTNDRGDMDLERMKAEIEMLRVEKERIQQLQAMEARERELSRKIVQRELSKGTDGPS